MIEEIVRNIVVLAILTLFWEMLLPEGSIRKFVRVVLGLLVLLAILNPLAALFSEDIAPMTITAPAGAGNTKGLIDSGIAINQDLQQQNEQAYLQGLEGQIRALVLLSDGIEDAQVEVTMAQGGGVEKVAVTAQQQMGRQNAAALTTKISRVVSSFYDLQLEQISVAFSN